MHMASKKILNPPTPPVGPLPANVPCDLCGKLTPQASLYSLGVNFNMPGGPTFAAYQCPALQHFGCCMAHAVIAALACPFEHLDAGNHNAHGKPWQDAGIQAIQAAIEAYVVQVGGNGI